ncbi:hypothetical protein ACTQ4E_10585, partial [Lawsonibacter sp. LCP25S3_G6]|uniref:hypothetical protein n=1 Tax=unclassified Lawsonibacter TaxID=2617946 RepID=UPI003F9B048E
MAYLMLGIVMIFLSIVFRLAAVFRLTIPLLYALVVPTVFHEWYYANQTLANVIWYVLLAVVVLSWVVSLVRKVRGILLRRREDKMLELRGTAPTFQKFHRRRAAGSPPWRSRPPRWSLPSRYGRP